MSTMVTAPSLPSFLGGSTSEPVTTATKSVVKEAAETSSKNDLLGNRARTGMKDGSRIRCPHCDFPTTTRTSERLSKLVKRSSHICTNPECSYAFLTHTEIVLTLSLSSIPDPSVSLPLSSHLRSELVKATLKHSSQVEYTPQFTKPVSGDLFEEPPTD